jgi:endonuclease/exonuclease/phosphatase family metal-dependent hydrolase
VSEHGTGRPRSDRIMIVATARLTVATWNLLHGLDVRTGRIDLGRVAADIEALDVDVVALQEVDRGLRRTGRVDQVEELARRLGWHGTFAAALLGDPQRGWTPGPGAGPDPGGPAYGVGLLSRTPMAGVERCALPGGGHGERRPDQVGSVLPGWDREPRAVLRACVGGVVVATTHLSFQVWRSVRQLRVALGFAGPGPAVLLGDLNLPFPVLRVALAGTGWSASGAGKTYPSWRPNMQLDHVLQRGAETGEVQVGPRGPSDHLPVRATVTWG